MSNNSETVRDTRNVSMNHDYETEVALSDSVIKSRPSGEITMTSYPVGNKTWLSRKPCIPDETLLRNAIRKSWSLIQNPSWKNRLKRPIAEKSRWRHIRLAIKPRYLGSHASQIKSYYGSLSGSHGRSFRIIRRERTCEVPLNGEITMTSYPASKKTWLSQKPCIEDKKLLLITIMKSWSFSNFYKKNSKY